VRTNGCSQNGRPVEARRSTRTSPTRAGPIGVGSSSNRVSGPERSRLRASEQARGGRRQRGVNRVPQRRTVLQYAVTVKTYMSHGQTSAVPCGLRRTRTRPLCGHKAERVWPAIQRFGVRRRCGSGGRTASVRLIARQNWYNRWSAALRVLVRRADSVVC